MKKTLKTIALSTVFILAGYMAEAQPHPNTQSGGGNVTGGRIGSSAPIGEGLNILLLSALAFGSYKFYRTRHDVLPSK